MAAVGRPFCVTDAKASGAVVTQPCTWRTWEMPCCSGWWVQRGELLRKTMLVGALIGGPNAYVREPCCRKRSETDFGQGGKRINRPGGVTCYHIRVPETLNGASVIRQSVGHGAEHYNSANKAGT